MKPITILAALLLTASLAVAQETPVASTVKSVGLFKNGVVVIQEEISVTGGGRFILTQVPSPIHGTFFLESDAIVETTVTQRNVAEPMDDEQIEMLDLQKDFAGRQVRIHFTDTDMPSAEGVVAVIPEADPNRAISRSRNYARSDYSGGMGGGMGGGAFAGGGFSTLRSVYIRECDGHPSHNLVLDTPEGRTFLMNVGISRIDVTEKVEKVVRKHPVMIFDVKTEKPAKIRLFYLTKGISWAPSYRIDITDPKRLKIEQTAVIMNELRQLKKAEVSLISGFPKIECENVDAPFSPGSSMTEFFRQLANRTRDAGKSAATQQAVMFNAFRTHADDDDDDEASGLSTASEGPDIHLQKIGPRSMSVGDTLSLTTGRGEAEYERIVEWTIPDARDIWGQYVDSKADSDPWDMIRFRNPLPFPMTTAPATIVSESAFFGQNTSFWANPNEMTKLPITKSMSVRAKSVEYERGDELSEPREIKRDGHDYREATIDTELMVVNRRAEPVKMFVSRQFSGELEKSPAGTTVRALNEDLKSVNRKHELQWEFTLKPGETKKLKYAYVVLIRM